jgi:SdrD B-like domain
MSGLNEPLRHLARRLVLCLCGLGGVAWIGTAQGQSLASATPPPASAPVYQDKYIGGGTLAPDISAGDEVSTDSQGLARSLQIDGVVSALHAQGGAASSNALEDGIVIKSQWETAEYGAWSLDGSARTGASSSGPSLGPTEQGQGGTIALRQRGMPFDGGWQADNALGDINTPDIGLVQFQPRFYLPTSPMQGLTTEWRGPNGLELTAGGGVPGLYDGIAVPDFRTLGGSIATAGAQWSPASNWTLGGQFVDANDVNLTIGPVIDGLTTISSATGLLSAAWHEQGERLQLTLMDGDVSGKPDGIGAWLDGSIAQGSILQTAGLFRIDPNMTWGNQLIANDMQGGYYRLGYQSRQWLADVGVDEVRSVSGLSADTTFVTGDARYQLSRDWGIGTVENLSHTDGANNWSLEGYIDHVNSFGTGRVQADYADTTTGQDTTLTVNQNWSTSVDVRLSTSAYLERVSGALYGDVQQNSTLLGLAASGGGQFTSRLGIDGNVQWARAIQGSAAPAVSTNVSLTWQVAQHWKILATYYDSQTGSWTPPTVVSPLTPPIATVVPAVSQRGAFLTFRYQRAAGSHFVPLGGKVGGGAGEIRGMVYLDANSNGRFDAGEAGAPNVTVVLDGQFSVQTDANGHFDFPAVAAGHHVVTVLSDNLPLPWTLVNGGRTEVDVGTRDRTDVDIAAVRIR